MDKMIFPLLVALSAVFTAGVLDFIASNDLGFPQENIRIEALILASIIGLGLAVGHAVQKGSK